MFKLEQLAEPGTRADRASRELTIRIRGGEDKLCEGNGSSVA